MAVSEYIRGNESTHAIAPFTLICLLLDVTEWLVPLFTVLLSILTTRYWTVLKLKLNNTHLYFCKQFEFYLPRFGVLEIVQK